MILSVPNSLKCLVEMISSLHAVMQNEAIFAINLICSYFFGSSDNAQAYSNISEQVTNLKLDNAQTYFDHTYVAELLITADIAKNIAFIINKYHEKMSFETVNNLVRLLFLLSKSTTIVDHLEKFNMSNALSLLLKNKNSRDLSNDINKLMNIHISRQS